jgi:hypothetical protein
MDSQPTDIESIPATEEVVGLEYSGHGNDIDVEPVPKTSFDEIVTRGGNNPDGKFILLE